MKKIVSLVVLAGLTAVPAFAAPSHIARDSRGGYNVTYDYKDKEKTGWYVTGRAELSFMNWKNKYSSDWPLANAEFDSDKYSFEPVFGGSLSAGRKFGYFWRAELEAGFIGQFSDKDAGFEFNLSAPYVMANGYYDFTNGLYVGGGLGIAVPITRVDSDIFLSGERTKTSVSPMAGVMLGWTTQLDDSLVLDIRYRLAGFNGTKHTRHFETEDNSQYYFENKIGLILDNSISIGLRYEF